MGWWGTFDGEVMGDDPADELKRALKRMATPTVKELLAALTEALRQSPEELTQPPASYARIVFEILDGAPLSSSEVGDARPGDVPLVREGLIAAGAAWRRDFGRLPSLSELLSALAFVLRFKPERFCADGAAWQIDNVSAQ